MRLYFDRTTTKKAPFAWANWILFIYDYNILFRIVQ